MAVPFTACGNLEYFDEICKDLQSQMDDDQYFVVEFYLQGIAAVHIFSPRHYMYAHVEAEQEISINTDAYKLSDFQIGGIVNELRSSVDLTASDWLQLINHPNLILDEDGKVILDKEPHVKEENTSPKE